MHDHYQNLINQFLSIINISIMNGMSRNFFYFFLPAF